MAVDQAFPKADVVVGVENLKPGLQIFADFRVWSDVFGVEFGRLGIVIAQSWADAGWSTDCADGNRWGE